MCSRKSSLISPAASSISVVLLLIGALCCFSRRTRQKLLFPLRRRWTNITARTSTDPGVTYGFYPSGGALTKSRRRSSTVNTEAQRDLLSEVASIQQDPRSPSLKQQLLVRNSSIRQQQQQQQQQKHISEASSAAAIAHQQYLSGLRQHPVTTGFGGMWMRDSVPSWRASATFAPPATGGAPPSQQPQAQRQQQQQQRIQSTTSTNAISEFDFETASVIDDEDDDISDSGVLPRTSRFAPPSEPPRLSLWSSGAGSLSDSMAEYPSTPGYHGLTPAPPGVVVYSGPPPPPQEVSTLAPGYQPRNLAVPQAVYSKGGRGPQTPMVVMPDRVSSRQASEVSTTSSSQSSGRAGQAAGYNTGYSASAENSSGGGSSKRQGGNESSLGQGASLVEVTDIARTGQSRFSTPTGRETSDAYSWDDGASDGYTARR